LSIVYFSYRQTIQAYPGGGGSYTVARQNLGASAGLLAAAALLIDYVLVVAVGISAGVGALVSAAPGLLPYTRRGRACLCGPWPSAIHTLDLPGNSAHRDSCEPQGRSGGRTHFHGAHISICRLPADDDHRRHI
jgi:amino acid transporter